MDVWLLIIHIHSRFDTGSFPSHVVHNRLRLVAQAGLRASEAEVKPRRSHMAWQRTPDFGGGLLDDT